MGVFIYYGYEIYRDPTFVFGNTVLMKKTSIRRNRQ